MTQLPNGSGWPRKKKSKTGKNGSHHSAQVGPGDRGRKKSKKEWILFDFDLDLIWIEIGVLKNIFLRNEFARPVRGTIFLVYVSVVCGPKSVGGITRAKCAHAQSQYWAVKSDQ